MYLNPKPPIFQEISSTLQHRPLTVAITVISWVGLCRTEMGPKQTTRIRFKWGPKAVGAAVGFLVRCCRPDSSPVSLRFVSLTSRFHASPVLCFQSWC